MHRKRRRLNVTLEPVCRILLDENRIPLESLQKNAPGTDAYTYQAYLVIEPQGVLLRITLMTRDMSKEPTSHLYTSEVFYRAELVDPASGRVFTNLIEGVARDLEATAVQSAYCKPNRPMDPTWPECLRPILHRDVLQVAHWAWYRLQAVHLVPATVQWGCDAVQSEPAPETTPSGFQALSPDWQLEQSPSHRKVTAMW